MFRGYSARSAGATSRVRYRPRDPQRSRCCWCLQPPDSWLAPGAASSAAER